MDRQTLVFDADDTLWENNVLFERVVADYLDWIAHQTLDHAALRAVLDDVERVNVVTYGFGSASFLRSLHDCFERIGARPATATERREIDALVVRLVDHDVELLPDVAETLATLAGRHDLLLLTKGEPAEQQRKIDVSGLASYFRSTHIVADKIPATYRDLVAQQGLPIASTWMIGNSPRSDIVAAREAGLRAVFIPHEHTWVLEDHAIDPDDDGVLRLDHFAALLVHF